MSDDRTWHTSEYPELRDGPPWVMEEMIAAQPGAVAAILATASPAADAIAAAAADAARAGDPVVVTGCGTSEHGAIAVAELLGEALRASGSSCRPEPRQALDAAFDPRAGGVCIAVSHDGGTRATLLALDAAAEAGAVTAAITANAGSAIAGAGEHVLVTPVADRSWCHTLAYTSAIAAGGALAGRLGADDGDGGALSDALALRPALEELAGRIAGGRRVLTAGLGVDLGSARELALKIEEGVRTPATALHLESLLHGHLAGCDADATALVLLASDPRGGARRDRRLALAAEAAAAIGIPTVALGAAAALDGLADGAASVALPEGPGLLAALLASAGALQVLTLALAHLAGTNPDLIRREETPYREAAVFGDGTADW